jgi:hypothetical protein
VREAEHMASATHNGNSVSARRVREMRDEIIRLRAENDRLRRHNQDLRLAMDAHLARTGSTATHGPIELTAGTCVGPRRRRHQS